MLNKTGMISNTVLRQCFFYLTKLTSLDGWKSIKWMNNRPLPNEAYCPTPIEHKANCLTHGIWIIPSIYATIELVNRSHNGAQMLSSIIYGATLIFLFSISTSFHCICFCNGHGQLKNVLHRCDRAMIYIFIAGSYFPWLTIHEIPVDGWASSMKWFVWLLATLGIIYQQTFHEKYKRLETFFYLVMGIGPALPIMYEHEFSGMAELKFGGILYIIGVIFFKSDGVIPFAHAIWHCFVVIAAATHYFAILNYLYPEYSNLGDNFIKS